MQVDDLPSIDPNVDYTQILPIQQKRTVAFINHFVMNTVECLNNFAQSCESRLMEFEYKIQKVEAALLIIESQLSSISGLDHAVEQNTAKNLVESEKLVTPVVDLPEIKEEKENVKISNDMEPRACEDARFQRFFKMIQFGVPPAAVKLKMQNEGFDPDILNTPNSVIAGCISNATSTTQNFDDNS